IARAARKNRRYEAASRTRIRVNVRGQPDKGKSYGCEEAERPPRLLRGQPVPLFLGAGRGRAPELAGNLPVHQLFRLVIEPALVPGDEADRRHDAETECQQTAHKDSFKAPLSHSERCAKVSARR